ncbi:methyltransferase domain-containing protein [Actinomycetaceae bacterium TAE3-ERU4]|nr:methyltransferase domain-containing protein [Actinomycetaceae bacterium TAE3-ERU4]
MQPSPLLTLTEKDVEIGNLATSLPPFSPAQVLELSSSLRGQGYDPQIIAQAISLAQLRQAAQAKFGQSAHSLFFTKDGLEQASRPEVAKYHAEIYKRAQILSVADLGCGIGAESRAFAQAGLNVTAVEIDLQTASYATHNLGEFPNAKVVLGDVRQLDLEAIADAIFVDPARRKNGKRIANPNEWSPPLDQVLKWSATLPAGIKVSPGIRHTDLPPQSHVQFTSVEGNTVEACIWTGKLAQALGGSGRSALIFRHGKSYEIRDENAKEANASITPGECAPVGTYIYEPDGALVRSGALASFAKKWGLYLLDPRIAYLTGEVNPFDLPRDDRDLWDACLQTFRVISTHPLKPKALKKACHEAGFGAVDILNRGTDILPQRLRQQLKLNGNGIRGTVITTRVGDKHLAFLGVKLNVCDG